LCVWARGEASGRRWREAVGRAATLMGERIDAVRSMWEQPRRERPTMNVPGKGVRRYRRRQRDRSCAVDEFAREGAHVVLSDPRRDACEREAALANWTIAFLGRGRRQRTGFPPDRAIFGSSRSHGGFSTTSGSGLSDALQNWPSPTFWRTDGRRLVTRIAFPGNVNALRRSARERLAPRRNSRSPGSATRASSTSRSEPERPISERNQAS
jgi:hypothetical protein